MNDFKKNNRFGGGFGGKRDFQKRPSFGGDRGRFSGGFGGRDMMMHQATCASCGKVCEVPFKPNGKKPVYCKECFAANGGPEASGGDRPRFDRKERFNAPRKEFGAPAHQAQGFSRPDAGIAEVKRQIDALNTKIDKIMAMLSADKAPAPQPEVASAEAVAPVEAVPVEKKVKKAVAKKKK